MIYHQLLACETLFLGHILYRPGGTGPVGQVLAGPTFQRGNYEITIFTDIVKGDSIIDALYRFSLPLGCFCGGMVL